MSACSITRAWLPRSVHEPSVLDSLSLGVPAAVSGNTGVDDTASTQGSTGLVVFAGHNPVLLLRGGEPRPGIEPGTPPLPRECSANELTGRIWSPYRRGVHDACASRLPGSNRRHPHYKCGTLPTELRRRGLRNIRWVVSRQRSLTWDRTRNLPINSRLLCQLSYQGMVLRVRTPGPVRTDDPPIKSRLLYQTELRRRGPLGERRWSGVTRRA